MKFPCLFITSSSSFSRTEPYPALPGKDAKMSDNTSCYINYYIKPKRLVEPLTHDERDHISKSDSQIHALSWGWAIPFGAKLCAVIPLYSKPSRAVRPLLSLFKLHKESKLSCKNSWESGLMAWLSVCLMIEVTSLLTQLPIPPAWIKFCVFSKQMKKGVKEVCIAVNVFRLHLLHTTQLIHTYAQMQRLHFVFGHFAYLL